MTWLSASVLGSIPGILWDNHQPTSYPSNNGLLLQGFLIPIFNTPFIELSTTAYLWIISLLVLSKGSTSCTISQESPKSNRLQFLSPRYRKIKYPRRATTLRPTPRMVMRWCSSTSIPGSRYPRVCRNEKQLGRCGLYMLLPTEKDILQLIRQLVEEHIRVVSNVDQTYVAWSRRWIRVEIVNLFLIDRILNNILRSSSVFRLLTVDCCLSLSSHCQSNAISL